MTTIWSSRAERVTCGNYSWVGRLTLLTTTQPSPNLHFFLGIYILALPLILRIVPRVNPNYLGLGKSTIHTLRAQNVTCENWSWVWRDTIPPQFPGLDPTD